MSDTQPARRQRNRQSRWSAMINNPVWRIVGGSSAFLAAVVTIAAAVPAFIPHGAPQMAPVTSQASGAVSDESSPPATGSTLPLVGIPAPVKDLDDPNAEYHIDTRITPDDDNTCLTSDSTSWARVCLLVISDANVQVPAIIEPLSTFTVAGVLENSSDKVEHLMVRITGSAPSVAALNLFSIETWQGRKSLPPADSDGFSDLGEFQPGANAVLRFPLAAPQESELSCGETAATMTVLVKSEDRAQRASLPITYKRIC